MCVLEDQVKLGHMKMLDTVPTLTAVEMKCSDKETTCKEKTGLFHLAFPGHSISAREVRAGIQGMSLKQTSWRNSLLITSCSLADA